MKEASLENLGRYALAILLGAAVAGGGVLHAQLVGGHPIDWTPVLVATLGSLLTGVSAMLLPKLGAETLNPDTLTERQTRQVADELERRMKKTPSKK